MNKLKILSCFIIISLNCFSQSRDSKYSFTMISNQSENFYDLAGACIYCDTLTEGGFTDWILPNTEEWDYLCNGGALNSFTRNSIWLMMRDSYIQDPSRRRIWGNTNGDIFWQAIQGGCSTPNSTHNSCPQYVRCIR